MANSGSGFSIWDPRVSLGIKINEGFKNKQCRSLSKRRLYVVQRSPVRSLPRGALACPVLCFCRMMLKLQCIVYESDPARHSALL